MDPVLIKCAHVLTTLSLVATFITLVIYKAFHRLKNFFFMLGIFLILCDLPLLLSSYYLTIMDDRPCKIIGPLREFSSISVMFWNAIMMWTLFKTVRFNLDEDYLHSYKARFLLLGYGLPIIISTILIYACPYKAHYLFCWIEYEDDTYEKVLFWAVFGIPLAISVIISTQYYIRTFIYLRKFDIQQISGEFYAFALYPIVLLSCNAFSVIDRLYSTLFPDEEVPLWIVNVHVLTRQAQCLLNCLVFIFNPTVRRQMSRALRRCCKKRKAHGQDQDIDHDEQLDSNEDNEDSDRDSIPYHEQTEMSGSQKLQMRRFTESYDKCSIFFEKRTGSKGSFHSVIY